MGASLGLFSKPNELVADGACAAADGVTAGLAPGACPGEPAVDGAEAVAGGGFWAPAGAAGDVPGLPCGAGEAAPEGSDAPAAGAGEPEAPGEADAAGAAFSSSSGAR